MNTQNNELLSMASDNNINDALFYIPKLQCNSCGSLMDFHLVKGVPHCNCCDSVTEFKQSDIDSVSNRSPRAPILRFSSYIA